MRILAFSDVVDWDRPYKQLVDRYKPTIVALAGDLTSDGGARFWRDALEFVPAFRRSKSSLRRRLGVVYSRSQQVDVIPHESLVEYRDALRNLELRYRRTTAFLTARKRIHVDKFYRFLEYAGRRAEVLVVKGDHDDDFPDDYDCQRIDAIAGCHEISGKTHTVWEFTALGLGFAQAGYRRPLRRLITQFKGRVGVVIAHAPQENARLLAEFQPSLLIRGHFGGGRFLIDGVPSLFTVGAYALAEIRGKGLPRIMYAGDDGWEMALRRTYPWMEAYPTPTPAAKRHGVTW